MEKSSPQPTVVQPDLHFYRNGPMNKKDINDELPGSTEILIDLETLKVMGQEIDS
jgi:hypothetical protein